MSEIHMLTMEEKAKLDAELKRLIARRPVIAAAIAEAREKGDLKENADYHAARDEMAHNEMRVKNLEDRLRHATVIDTADIPADMVFLGSTIKVRNTKTGDEEVLRIVGDVGKGSLDLDSDILEVSAKSPLGEALIRARVG
ncbi:MAG: GreA/GreB family elongation factor, partial [Phycisphaerae bacterium]